MAAPAAAGQQASADEVQSPASGQAGSLERARTFGVQLAFHEGSRSTNFPVGTIRLRVIPRVGGATLKTPITWRVETYGRDEKGRRHLLAEVNGATPELVLPAAWYIVYAHLPDQVITHPVQVTAGRTFKYTLIKNKK